MAPPAINLAVSDPSFSVAPSSKIHPSEHEHDHNQNNHINNINNNNSSRSSEEERESTDGAVDELHVGGAAVIPSGKRPRGRPPGSKNKAKMPTYLSVDPQDALRSHVMEVASGADISSCLAAYARTRGRGVAILHAVGSVAGVCFRQQPHDVNSSSSPNSLFLKGKLDIISLAGTVLPDNTSLGPAGLTVFVSGPHGQVMGGPVEGRLVAAGTVMVMAATFSTATYEKLPLEAEAAAAAASDGLGGAAGQSLRHQEPGPAGPGMEDPRSGGYHPGFNMNMGMENGSSSVAGGGPPENSSYAWFLQQQQQQHNNNNNGRPLYMNNN